MMQTDAADPGGMRVVLARLPRPVTPPPREPMRCTARVARLLAFAHQIRRGLAEGTWADPAAAAKAHRLTRARVSQLLRLTRMAPEIQIAVLSLEAVDAVEPLAERSLRTQVARFDDWEVQRAMWARHGTHHQGALPVGEAS